MFGLADCNNFFVSCERVFRPDLEGKPVVVLSNNDGCAISRSNEAKKLGVKMGQPLFQFQPLVKAHDIALFSSNFLLYGDMSRRVRTILSSAAPSIEIYSIDECFLNLNGMENTTDFGLWAKELSAKCRHDVGIPISVGVSPTKTLSKIASKLCKQYPRLQGGCYMHRPEDIAKVLRQFPIEDIWGIGRRYSARFKNFGIKTAADFVGKSEAWVRNEMGTPGLNTWKELQGIPCIDFEDTPDPRKQIMVSRSFAKEIDSFDDLSQQVSLFCTLAVEKLRKQNSACHAAIVFVWTNRHHSDAPQQQEGKLITFPVATDSTLEINSCAMATLKSLFKKGFSYKRAGICLTEIISASSIQLSMFDTIDHEKHSKLMTTVDRINKKEGHTTIGVASQSFDGIRMNREHLSPEYTTSWSDIITVHC